MKIVVQKLISNRCKNNYLDNIHKIQYIMFFNLELVTSEDLDNFLNINQYDTTFLTNKSALNPLLVFDDV